MKYRVGEIKVREVRGGLESLFGVLVKDDVRDVGLNRMRKVKRIKLYDGSCLEENSDTI